MHKLMHKCKWYIKYLFNDIRQPNMPPITNTYNILGFDAIRGILAIIVCFSHSWYTYVSSLEQNITTWHYIFGIGARFSVIGFFCISGFVIALSIKRNIDQYKDFSGVDFFFARALRILPPLLVIIGIAYLLTEAAAYFHIDKLPSGVNSLRQVYATDIKTQILALETLLTDGNLNGVLNGPLWSLQYEIQLYIIIGLASIGLFSKKRLIIRIISFALLGLYSYHAFNLKSLNGTVTLQFMWYLIFLIGVLAFLCRRALSKGICVTVSLLGIAGCFYLMARFDVKNLLEGIDSAKNITLVLAQLFFAIGFSAFILLLVDIKLFNRFSKLGNFSYTLYILHFPVMLFLYFAIVNLIPHQSKALAWTSAILVAFLCILISRTLSRLIENTSAHRALITKSFHALRARCPTIFK
jgi:peptidoglycan/LPS O-acetylase OafA/YrhL